MKEQGNEFWKAVLARVASEREAGQALSLEEAERRLAEIEEEEVEPLEPARIDRIVASVTGKGGASSAGAREPGGRVVTLPVWTRRAVAAGLLVVPLVAVAFWQAFRHEDRPTIPYFEDPDAPLDYPRAMFWLTDPEATLQVAAEHAGPGQSHEAWAGDFRVRALQRVLQYVSAAVGVLQELRSQPAPLGTTATESLHDLRIALDALVTQERSSAEPIQSLLMRLQASDASALEKTRLIREVTPQLRAGIEAVRRTVSEGGQLQTKGQAGLENLRLELSR